jgi:LysM repeat protein
MAKLGNVSLHIEKESENHKVEATMYAVEKGEPFTDHVAKRPSEFSLSGYILADNWEGSFKQLKTMMEGGEITRYVGKMIAQDVIITDIQGDHGSEIKNGASLRISLRRIRITRTAWVKLPPKTKPNVKPVTNSGKKKIVQKTPPRSSAVYHIIRKGDTYWGLSKKYGSSIQQLRTWNKWPDRSIPIGGKARVK